MPTTCNPNLVSDFISVVDYMHRHTRQGGGGNFCQIIFLAKTDRHPKILSPVCI